MYTFFILYKKLFCLSPRRKSMQSTSVNHSGAIPFLQKRRPCRKGRPRECDRGSGTPDHGVGSLASLLRVLSTQCGPERREGIRLSGFFFEPFWAYPLKKKPSILFLPKAAVRGTMG